MCYIYIFFEEIFCNCKLIFFLPFQNFGVGRTLIVFMQGRMQLVISGGSKNKI